MRCCRAPAAVDSDGAVRDADAAAESKKAKYERLNAEADRALASLAGRRNAVIGRASTLVGAASIGASVSAVAAGPLNAAAALAFLAAAILGVVALWPRSGDGLNLGSIFDQSWVTTSEQIELTLLQVKLKSLDEKPLFRLANIVRWGFVLLTVAILLLAGGAGLTVVEGDNVGDKTPAQEPQPQTGPPRDPDPAFITKEIREDHGGRPAPSPTERPARRG